MKAYICAMMVLVLLSPAIPAFAQPEKVVTIASSKDASPSPDWMPGDPFDKYAEIRCNFLKDVKTGQTYPCSEMPPGPDIVVNISVVLKPGVQETISFAILNVTVWFATKPNEPRFGEYRMHSVSAKKVEVNKEIPNLSPCTRVYWHIKLWDQANRMIDSSNSQAAKDLQNYTVRGSCIWPGGSTFRDEMNITQDPYSAREWYPKPPSEVPPGANMSADTSVVVRMASIHFVQMPWVIMYFNQTTYDGKMNNSYMTAVRGHCRDQYSPSACDVSDTDLSKANGSSYEFYLPGVWAGTYIEYSILAVDYRVYDYSSDPEYKNDGWNYIMERKFCQRMPEACLASPDYYYYVYKIPEKRDRYIGPLIAQLLNRHVSITDKEQVQYAQGCVQFSNDTVDPKTGKPWTSMMIPTDEWGVAVSPVVDVNGSSLFTIKAWAPCQSSNMQVATLLIPNADGPGGLVNNTVFIFFISIDTEEHIFTPVGWRGDEYAIVWTIASFGFFAPLMFFAIRFFNRREEVDRTKRREAEQRFKI